MIKFSTFLTYAGALPFLGCALLLTIDINQFQPFGSVQESLNTYSLLISSFMSGSHWGQNLHVQKAWKKYLQITSILIALAIWFSYMTLDFHQMIVVYILSFLALLGVDYRLRRVGLNSREYFQTRFWVSGLVIASLIISGIVSEIN